MKLLRSLLLACFIPGCCLAQSYSLGGAAGFGVYHDASITNPNGSAQAGFGPRFAAGAVLGQDMGEHFGGELRYTYRDGDSELKSAGTEVNMDAAAHAIHYDFLGYFTGRKARVRPYAALGAGIKYYTATGREYLAQPLSDFAVLTHANQVEGLLSAGGGVKVPLNQHWLVRIDFRYYASPFPEKLFAPAPDARVHGWLHDFVPMIGFDWRFGH